MTASGPRKVAIVGGGCGGVAAAFWLSSPELRGAWEVTLFTQGWRLGGKGASGRRCGPDHAIKEHGLHMWFGCYHRAFQMMRLCYAEQPRPAAFDTLADAFIPMLRFALESHEGAAGARDWSPWAFSFPRQGDFPGGERGPAILERASGFAQWIGAIGIRAIRGLGRPQARAGWTGRSWRRAAILVSLVGAFCRGYLRDIVFHGGGGAAGMAALEDLDFRDWLRRSGASADACDSAPVRALYDLAFAYPGGETDRGGQLAAAPAVGLVLELMGYRGAPFFKMASGMGDVIFAPLYRVLEARGVRIELFHRLEAVETSESGRSIGALIFRRQARVIGDRYQPFISVAGEDCWPDQPLWDQIAGGAGLCRAGVDYEHDDDQTHVAVRRLRQGEDFDAVILAVPPDALKPTTRALDHPDWIRMLETSASVATQAFQLWLDRAPQAIGWRGPGLVSSYHPPFSTWADMSHLLPREAWPDGSPPESLHYFCGPLPDQDAAAPDARRRAHMAMEDWLDRHLAPLWPGSPGDWRAMLVDSWAQANVDASERYVQAPPGTARFRLPSDPDLFDNLFLAGDWTRTRYCGGCVENAVQSGLAAARAVSGRPTLGGGGPL